MSVAIGISQLREPGWPIDQCNVNGGRNDHSTDGSRNGQRGQAEPAPTLIDKAVINQAINSVLAPQTVSSDSDSV